MYDSDALENSAGLLVDTEEIKLVESALQTEIRIRTE